MQAAVLQLYDPDRSKAPLRDRPRPPPGRRSSARSSDCARDWMRAARRRLAHPHRRHHVAHAHSPARSNCARMLPECAPALVRAGAASAARREAMRLAFGRAARPALPAGGLRRGRQPRRRSARSRAASGHACARLGAAARRSRRRTGACVCMSPKASPSLTGTVAATRLPVRCLAHRRAGARDRRASSASMRGNQPELERAGSAHGSSARRANCARMQGNRCWRSGRICRPPCRRWRPSINEQLGNVGTTVWYSEPVAYRAGRNAGSLADLARDIDGGRVETLVILDCNPVYAAPGELRFAELLPRVRIRIHAGLHARRDRAACHWHLPLSHALESWSDARAVDGTATIIQPVVAPLYSVRTAHQIVDMLLGTDRSRRRRGRCARPGRKRSAATSSSAGGSRCMTALSPDTAAQPVAVTAQAGRAAGAATACAGDDVDVVFRPDPTHLGRPLRQHRVAAGAAEAADQDHLGQRDLRQPGLRRSARHLSTATASRSRSADRERARPGLDHAGPGGQHGRAVFSATAAATPGRVGDGIGYDAYAVRSGDDPWRAAGTLRRASGQQQLATTQLHHRMDGFDFVREVTADHPTVPASTEAAADTLSADWPSAGARLGHGDRSRSLHRLQCLRLRLQRREQRAGGRQGPGREGPRDAVAARRPLLHRRRRQSAQLLPAGAVHALREGAVRDGLPGARHRAFARRPQPDGLQPLHRHAHLLELLPLQGAPLQLVRLPRAGGFAERMRRTIPTSRCARAASWRNAPIAPAHRGRARRGRQGEPPDPRAARSSPPASRPVRPRRSCSAISTTRTRRSPSGGSSGRHYVLLEELGTRPRTTYLARWNDGRPTRSR